MAGEIRVISISHSEDDDERTIIVWYYAPSTPRELYS
jgi:hypothetical protein